MPLYPYPIYLSINIRIRIFIFDSIFILLILKHVCGCNFILKEIELSNIELYSCIILYSRYGLTMFKNYVSDI